MIYVLAVIFLTILFFSNDFGLVDIQKTAIVLAVGIDRENEEFIVNSRIASPLLPASRKRRRIRFRWKRAAIPWARRFRKST